MGIGINVDYILEAMSANSPKYTEQHVSYGSKPFIDVIREQEAKFDAGKPRLSLVPPALIEAVGAIRTYGTQKYGDPENWRQVSTERYKDALMRHITAWLRDPESVDEESGYRHLWHAACNIAFILEVEHEQSRAKTAIGKTKTSDTVGENGPIGSRG